MLVTLMPDHTAKTISTIFSGTTPKQTRADTVQA